MFPFAPASIPGLGAFGGFEFQVLDQAGTDINALANATYAMAGAGNQSPRLRGLFTSFTVNDPQLSVEIDRERALALGLPIGEITSALQIYLGSQYVNDFDFNNRAYRVYVQADKAFRSEPSALKQFYVRNRKGQMLPLESVVRVSETTAPQVISHFNLFRSATINGSAAPGFSSGQALQEMERSGGADAAAGHELRVVGPVARGEQGRPPVVPHLRAGAAARVPHAGGAVRKPGAAVHRAAGRAAGRAGRAWRRSGRGGSPTTSTARSASSC